MTQTALTNEPGRPTKGAMNRWMTFAQNAVLFGAMALAGGCVNVTAPDKPIVINLNINITQQVVYRLDGEAKALIQSNPGIF